jgi:hypothetical protein
MPPLSPSFPLIRSKREREKRRRKRKGIKRRGRRRGQ